jgi:SEFIR domain
MGLESLSHSIMCTVRLTDHRTAALPKRLLNSLSSELAHPLKSDKRRVRNMTPSPPRVFISYSHDSPEHAERVLALAQRLREDGVDAWIDRYENGTPEEGWPRWMLNRLDWAEMVLLVCTETYYRRFRGQDELDKGKGADWEGQLLTLDLYDAKSKTVNFVPILFSDRCKQFIPEPLRGVTHYLLDPDDNRSATDYSRLLAFFHGTAGVAPTPLGLPKEVTSRRARPMVFITHEKGIGSQQQPTLPRRNQRGSGRNPPPPPGGLLFYATVSLVAFLFGLAILSLILWNAQLLVSLGLTGNFYYVLLLALGLSAAAFLFGLLQSHAMHRGHTGWGHLELGGAIVGCALVVTGGFYLVPNPLPFAVTVFVHGESGIHDLVPKESCEVVMELGPEVRRQEIGPNGTVYFANVAPNYRGQEVPLWVESKQFEPVYPDRKYPLKADAIQLEVRKKPGRISGRVQDENGNPLADATISLAGLATISNSVGHFEFVLNGDQLKPELELDIVKAGYLPKHFKVVPNANEVVVQLTHAP